MPPSSRKRGAQAETDVQSPVKRTRVARSRVTASVNARDGNLTVTDGEVSGVSEGKLKPSPTIKNPRKASANTSVSVEIPSDHPTENASKKATISQKSKAKDSSGPKESTSAKTSKKSRKRVETEAVKVEEEGAENTIAADEEVQSVKATRKQKPREGKVKVEEGTVKSEKDEEDETNPKKPKLKRKTKEDKEAETMPLAARTAGLRIFIGAHVSGAKGVQNAVTNCVHIGGNAFALFLKSQRKWENPPLQDEHRDAFRANCIEHKYDAARHIVPHGSYLVNLAQEDPEKAKQAYDSFVEDLHRCEALGIKLYNFHPGTTNNSPRPAAIARIASALNRALSATTAITPLLETMAGSGTVIGSTFTDLSSIISLIAPDQKHRIGICLDTCHLFAAGYDLRSPTSFSRVLRDLDDTVGLEYVKALHLNDSKAPLGSRRDLHANIGTGFLGLRAFWNVVNEKAFEGLPMVLETPIDRTVNDGIGGEGGEETGSGEAKAKGKQGGAVNVPKEKMVDEHDERSREGISQEEPLDAAARETGKAKPGAKKNVPLKPQKPKTFEDKTIWAREIKLLESLIGMDCEGEEFKRLEKELADQGAKEREKYQEAFDRKVAKEEKVKTKGIESFFGKGKVKEKEHGSKKKEDPVVDDGSPLSELSELSDSSVQ